MSATVPRWVLRPLPANAVVDAALHKKIGEWAANLPADLVQIKQSLNLARSEAHYDPAANLAAEFLWPHVSALLDSPDRTVRLQLLEFAVLHLAPSAAARVCRRLAKDADPRVRAQVQQAIGTRRLREVALPTGKDQPWDATGWLAGVVDVDLGRHKTGSEIQAKNDLPPLATVGDLRELLDIRSAAQLGYFLLATDAENGPYLRFTIPKRDGSDRPICAPKPQLKWVQRRILERILARVPAHEAAHGFVPGRSTVTNAARHRGAAVVVKFDLKDFFPTIHYYRVLGLFVSLGYTVQKARFKTDDKSREVAPVLARLCCHTPDPKAWGVTRLPQGAPTSPAISNLVCRRLDSRLDGLAKKVGGVYTRYADDLTFSFPAADGVALGRFRWWVDQVCQQEGFLVNQAKFRVIRAAQRQVVTGIVVNDELRVPREDRRRFRAILHNCRRDGVASQAKGNPRFPAYLRGFASYVHMIHPEEGAELLRQVAELVGPTAEGGA